MRTRSSELGSMAIARGLPLVSAAVGAIIIWSTKVPLGIEGLPYPSGRIVVGLWCVAMCAVAFWPSQTLNAICGGLSVFVWMGRATGFAEIALRFDRWDLSGAIAERVLILLLMLAWHWQIAFRLGRARGSVQQREGTQSRAAPSG